MDSSYDAEGHGSAGGGARAGEVFAWIPEAAGLDGEAFVADAVHFADYDVVEQAPDGTITRPEAGYLPITGFSLAGQPVVPDGLNAPDGTGWGAYTRVTGTGRATVSPDGTPTGATYDELSYELVGFNGLATYGFGEDGAVLVAGEIADPVVLLSGSLISGTVTFVPAEGGLAIEGAVSFTVDEVAPGFSLGRLDVLNLTIFHPPEDYSFPTPTTTRVDATSGTDGFFEAAPEKPVDRSMHAMTEMNTGGDADRPDPGYVENHPPAAPVQLPTGEHGGSYAVSNVYSFGDRLVDDGGPFSNAAAAEALGLPRPNASPLYFEGGFSDGPNWTANLAGLLGVPEDGRDDNFGYVLATARPIANPLDAFAAGSNLNTFGGQIDAFEEAVGSFAPTDLVTVTFGGNDITLPSGVSPEEGIALSVQAIVDGMGRLAHLGAENFLVTNLPNLELAPLFQDPGFLAQLGAEPGDFVPLVAEFNAQLEAALDAFEDEKGVDVDVADVNGLFDAIAADPGSYGFANVGQPVLALPPLEPGTPEVFNPAIDGQDPAVRAETLFVDPFFHPTAPGHVIIAEAARDVLLA